MAIPSPPSTSRRDWLDWHESFLERLDDRDFLVHLGTTLGLLLRPGPIAEVLDELRREADDRSAKNLSAQEAARNRAEDWLETWEMQAPAEVRSSAETLRGEVQRLKPQETSVGPYDTLEPNPIRSAVNDLDAVGMRAAEADPGLGRLLDNCREEMHPYVFEERSYELAQRTTAGFALKRLEHLVELINPPTHGTAHGRRYPRPLGLGGQLDELLFAARDLEGEREDPLPVVGRLVALARADLARVFLELRRRLDLTRTRLSVLRRFATWASWFARDELRDLANKTPGHVENVLAARLARFLFDHGHTPLTKPLVGRLEPDLLDPGALERLYVEAKQYSEPSRARSSIAQGVKQILDTAALLDGTPLCLEEAFLVVFALAGPRLDLPRTLRTGALTIHLVLVDLVPWEQVGSRRRETPIGISGDELVRDAETLTSSVTDR